MLGQGLFHIDLGIGNTHLAQTTAIGAQDQNLAPIQTTPRDQGIEAVAFDLAAPNAGKGVFELFLDCRDIDVAAVARFQTEVVDHQHLGAVAVVAADFVRDFVDHPEAHMLEHRQGIRQRHRRLRVVDLEPHPVARLASRAVQVQTDAVGGQGFLDHDNVVDRVLGTVMRGVAGPEGMLEPARQAQAFLGPEGRRQGFRQIVAPGPGGAGQPAFQPLGVEGRNLARLGRDDHMDAGQRRVAQHGREVGDTTVQCLAQDVLHPFAQRHGVAVARHIDHAGYEPAEVVLAHEQGDALAVLQMQDAHGGFQQLIDGNLEQLIARIGFQNVHHRLAVVAARLQAGALQHQLNPAAQQRNVARATVIGGGSEQPDEDAQARDPAVLVHHLDPDRIHMDAAMDGRPLVRFGHDDQARISDEGANLGRDLRQVRRIGQHRHAHVTQNTQGRFTIDRDGDLGPTAADLVIAGAEEGEIVVVHPTQELTHLVGFFLRGGAGGVAELVDDLGHAFAHRTPVLHRQADVFQNLAHALFDVALAFGGFLVDFDMHPGFDPGTVFRLPRIENLQQLALAVAPDLEDRMHHQMNRQPAPVHFRRN